MARAATVVTFAGAVTVAFAAGWLVRASVESPTEETTVESEGGEPPRRGESGSDDRRAASGVPTGDVPAAGATDDATPAKPAAGKSSPAKSAPGRTAGASPGRATRPLERTSADYRAGIAEAFARDHAGFATPSDAALDVAAARALQKVDAMRRAVGSAPANAIAEQVRILADHEKLRARIGTLSGAATVELCARGRVSLNATDQQAGPSSAVFDPWSPPAANERDSKSLRGGVLDGEDVFVIEAIHVEGTLAGPRGRSPEIRFSVPGAGETLWKGTMPRVGASFRGCAVVGSRELSTLQVGVEDAAVRVRYTGRVVPATTAPPSARFTMDTANAVGFLRTSVPIRLQVLADHGGANPRTLDISGAGNGRFSSFATTSIWDDSLDLLKNTKSVAFADGAGLVPPGCVFHVEQIAWRARLSKEQGKRSRFDLAIGPDPTKDQSGGVRRIADPDGEFTSGTGTGDVAVRPGEEKDIALTCHYFGMAEAVITGRLEPDKR